MIVAYKDMQESLADANVLHCCLVFAEGEGGLKLNKQPALLLMTDKELFLGGTSPTNHDFHHFSLEDVEEVSECARGNLDVLCISFQRGKEKNELFVCPSTTSKEDPKADPEGIKELASTIKKLAHIR
ncbi:hypothetical protein ACFLRC_03415 [Candidatus Altiarchaeota archaeon]